MSPSVGKKTMTISEEHARFSSAWGTETTRLPNAMLTWSIGRFLHPCMSRQHFALNTPIRQQDAWEKRSLGWLCNRSSLFWRNNSHFTTALETLQTRFSIHNLNHYFQQHNSSHSLINVLYFFQHSLCSLRKEFHPLSCYDNNPHTHSHSSTDKV